MTKEPVRVPIREWKASKNSERSAQKKHAKWEGSPERVRFGTVSANLINPVGKPDQSRWVDSDQITWGKAP